MHIFKRTEEYTVKRKPVSFYSLAIQYAVPAEKGHWSLSKPGLACHPTPFHHTGFREAQMLTVPFRFLRGSIPIAWMAFIKPSRD